MNPLIESQSEANIIQLFTTSKNILLTPAL